MAINDALKVGHRGLPGGLSLAKLFGPQHLAPTARLDRRAGPGLGPGTPRGPRPLARSQGRPDPQAPGESWANIYYALKLGRRGLPGGLTLAKFIAQYRNATPNPPPNAADNPS